MANLGLVLVAVAVVLAIILFAIPWLSRRESNLHWVNMSPSLVSMDRVALFRGDSNTIQIKGPFKWLKHYAALNSDRWGWQTVLVLRPLQRNGLPYEGRWQVGFVAGHNDEGNGFDTTRLCTIELTSHVGLLLGDGLVGFFAFAVEEDQGVPKFDPSSQLQLELVEKTTRQQLDRRTPLF